MGLSTWYFYYFFYKGIGYYLQPIDNVAEVSPLRHGHRGMSLSHTLYTVRVFNLRPSRVGGLE